jgi:hypothetical protein
MPVVMPNRTKRNGQRRLLSAEDLIALLEAEIAEAGSQTAWARRTGANRTSLNLALTGRQPITQNLLDALGFERVVAYTPRRK